jgi:hypothetical protein
MSQPNWHETEPQHEPLPEEPYINPQLEQLTRIEGGPPRRVYLQHMPKWLRVFGYCFIGFLLIEVLFGIYSSLTH